MGIWCALIWKEWLSLRWKMVALASIPTALLLFDLAYDWREIFVGLIAAVVSYVAVAPIFLAMHAAAAERADGTLEFIRGLPCDRRKMGLVRVLATLVALLVPLVGTMALFGVAIAHARWNTVLPREFVDPEGAVQSALVVIGVATSIYLWTAALAMNQTSELRAGAMGLGAVTGFGALAIFAMVCSERWGLEHSGWGPHCLYIATSLGPFGGWVAFEAMHLRPVDRGVLMLLQPVTLLLLVAVAARHYASLETWEWGHRPWLSDRTRALVWAQWRSVLPLGILAIATVIALSPVSDRRYPLAFLGSVWAIIVGVTMFAGEFEPRLYAFWRSRPIDPSAWFRIKYLAGAIVVLFCFDLPAAWLVQADQLAPRAVSPWVIGDSLAYLISAPLLHLSVYSFAAMIVCFVRQTIYAGIFSMSAMLGLVMLPALLREHHPFFWHMLDAWWILGRLSEGTSPMDPEWPVLPSLLVYVAFHAVVIAAATLAAWSSLKYDVAVRT